MKYVAWCAAAAALVGCGNKTSLGTLEEGSGGSMGNASTGDGMSEAANTSGVSGPTTGEPTTGEPTTGEPTTGEPTTGAESGESGSITECAEAGADLGCLPHEVPCGDNCGAPESQFDPNGCVRKGCQMDGECAPGQRCFVGQNFGLCEGSGLACQYDAATQMCGCVSDPECGGGHCIPEALYPVSSPGPMGLMLVNDDCGPADGPLTVFRWLVEGEGDGCDLSPPYELMLAFDGVLEAGSYAFGPLRPISAGYGEYVPFGAGSEVSVKSATVTVDSVAGGVVSGSYTVHVILDEGFDEGLVVLKGDFSDTQFCPTMPLCG